MAALITCALGSEAHKLKKRLTDPDIILGDHADVPEFMLRSGKLIKLPPPTGASYQHEMLTLCLDRGINTVYPLSATEKIALAESSQLFAEYGITIKDVIDGL